MRTKEFLAVATGALLSLFAHTPRSRAQQIEINHTSYRLGMAERDAETDTSKNGNLSEKASDGERSISNVPLTGDNLSRYEDYGSLTFAGGKLVKAEKQWLLGQQEHTAADVASAIDAAVTSATEGGASYCLVQTLTTSEPDQHYEETFIICHKPKYVRQVVIYTKVLRSGGREFTPTFVEESLEKSAR